MFANITEITVVEYTAVTAKAVMSPIIKCLQGGASDFAHVFSGLLVEGTVVVVAEAVIVCRAGYHRCWEHKEEELVGND